MIYDGDCNFCSLWVHRWQQTTRDHLDYLPFQDPCVAARFPEVPRGQFEIAVGLIQTDGTVYGGAEAVFRALASHPHQGWLFDCYERSPVFARATEWGYRLVARHRRLFSALTRLAWGRHLDPPTHNLVRGVFLRSLGLIYLIAFVSLWGQIRGLVGSNGILPADAHMQLMRHQAEVQHVGLDRYHLVPTLCWCNATDGFLTLQCAAGATLAVVLIIGIAPAPCLFLLWLIYLSLATVCREFLAFQWDNLLLETGFLAIFLAPLQRWPKSSRAAPPSRLVLWLLRWLLFKLMFQSGCVKLLSGDLTWRHLAVLTFHYETQPLPTWIGWFEHQLPARAQQASAAAMFGIELLVPFLIFAPRRLRLFACLVLVAFQVLIFLTGNYCFFNLLTIALCLLLLDDAALRAFLPAKYRNLLSGAVPQPLGAGGTACSPGTGEAHPPSPDTDSVHPQPPNASAAGPAIALQRSARSFCTWPVQITVPLAIIALVTSLVQFSFLFRVPVPWPRPVMAAYTWLEPLRTFNSYGLFAVMTTTRSEIIIQGSNDRITWRDYEFPYKPGDVKRRPSFVAPHQPRLDWQMWFAALGTYRDNLWLINLGVRLLQGSPQVLALFERNPFPGAPPRYIRALVYDYRFTNLAARRRSGAWWSRQEKGIYLPAVSLRDIQPPLRRGGEPARRNVRLNQPRPGVSVPPVHQTFAGSPEPVERLALDVEVGGIPGRKAPL
jgi:lipase maturation factor 1